eukprot:SAG11_NODE_2754_length_3007_cov_10.651307_1_plen_58_part_10
MIYGVWDVGSGKPWSWATEVGHYWRTGPDLGTRWGTTGLKATIPGEQPPPPPPPPPPP